MSPSRALYSLLAWLALPGLSLLIAWRSLRDRNYARGWSARFGRGGALAGSARSIWLHAVSVGEVQAASALLGALRAAYPQTPVVITCATPAGRERARAIADALVDVRYAPYDLGTCVRGAISRLRPAVLVIMETELWPNLLAGCAHAGVPVLIASARLSERSLRRLQHFPGLLQPALRSAVTVAAQSTADAARFAALGVPAARVSVCGNIKFDRTPGAELRAAGAALRARFAPGRLLWVAGSTHRGEESAALAAHAALRAGGSAAQRAALLVLAPRHKPRFDEVAGLLASGTLSWRRFSQVPAGDADAGNEPAVLLLDTIGDLERCYAAADLAFVGGSLVPVGGHTLLEPAALGVPVIAGPFQSAAPQVASELAAAGAAKIVGSAAELVAAVPALAADERARQVMSQAGLAVVAANRGALLRVMTLLRAWLG